MVTSMKAPLALLLLSVPLVQGRIPAECNANSLLAGGDYYCSVCPPGQYAASNTVQASVFGETLDCYSWSVAGLCGVIPGGQMGCDFVNAQIAAACAPTCEPLESFSIRTSQPTATPTAAPSVAPTAAPTFTFNLNFCDKFAREPCDDEEEFFACVEKKGKSKSKCYGSGDTLKGDETLINCGQCQSATEPAAPEEPDEDPVVVDEDPVVVDEPEEPDEVSIGACAASGFTCPGSSRAQVCVGKQPKDRRILKAPKTRCFALDKKLKKDEIILNCGECA